MEVKEQKKNQIIRILRSGKFAVRRRSRFSPPPPHTRGHFLGTFFFPLLFQFSSPPPPVLLHPLNFSLLSRPPPAFTFRNRILLFLPYTIQPAAVKWALRLRGGRKGKTKRESPVKLQLFNYPANLPPPSFLSPCARYKQCTRVTTARADPRFHYSPSPYSSVSLNYISIILFMFLPASLSLPPQLRLV